MSEPPILEVRDLTVRVARGAATRQLVRGVSFAVAAGETVGVVGASGSGKTMTALALLGLLPPGCAAGGSVRWRGRELLGRDHHELRTVRGAEIGFVPQDALSALHPFQRVDRQVAEALQAHQPQLRRADAITRAGALLHTLGVTHAPAGYPFQWSGGMRQRALIAIAIANRPALLIADEPTTALDLSTQAAVLALLRQTQQQTGTALLLISHDMDVMAQVADRVVVIGAGGRAVEHGTFAEVRSNPRAPETVRLMSVLRDDPDEAAAPVLTDTRGPELLHVEALTVRFPRARRFRASATEWNTAVDDVAFVLRAGETFGIVGESGGGKSTLARALVRLERPQAGTIMLEGRDLTRLGGRALQAARASIQLVFQDPASSLNPRRRIGASIAQPLHAHGRYRQAGGARRVLTLLERVGLPHSFADRFPHELSGGERQRVAIARALALEPRVVVLDEPVTSLDPAARAGILRLLRELQVTRGYAFVLIAHDLRLVRGLAHEVAVMRAGRFVEVAPTGTLFDAPQHTYTRSLLALARPRACADERVRPDSTR